MKTDLEVEDCDDQEISETLDYSIEIYKGMSCIKNKSKEVV